jgi:hypothetical protein
MARPDPTNLQVVEPSLTRRLSQVSGAHIETDFADKAQVYYSKFKAVDYRRSLDQGVTRPDTPSLAPHCQPLQVEAWNEAHPCDTISLLAISSKQPDVKAAARGGINSFFGKAAEKKAPQTSPSQGASRPATVTPAAENKSSKRSWMVSDSTPAVPEKKARTPSTNPQALREKNTVEVTPEKPVEVPCFFSQCRRMARSGAADAQGRGI